MREQIKVENGDSLGREESCKLQSEFGNRNHRTCLDIYIYIKQAIPREGKRKRG